MIHRNDRQTMGSMIDWDFVEAQNRKDRYADNARRKKKGIKTSKELGLDPTPLPVRLPPQGHIAIEETDEGEKQHLCPVCEKPFTRTTAGLARIKTYCSEECRLKGLARRARERYAKKSAWERGPRILHDRACDFCGRTYTPQTATQEYCSRSCAMSAYHARKRGLL